jgi:murein DD-endopeptidase MepM/ murein hydrolase activator NlpD
MTKHQQLARYIANNPDKVGKVVFFDTKRHHVLRMDFTKANKELTPELIASTEDFSDWVFATLKANKCKYGIGGYLEDRTLYNNSGLFNSTGETRSLHLGVDIWGDAGTMVKSPLDGVVHSFQDNDNKGDYGPTVILEHDLDGLKLYTLYGHLNRESFMYLAEGMFIEKGETLGEFGACEENGDWPPHLHFQLMFDIGGHKGDYPGACRPSEKETYIQNIPDPGLILRFPESHIV